MTKKKKMVWLLCMKRVLSGPHVSTSTHITWQPLMQMSNKWWWWRALSAYVVCCSVVPPKMKYLVLTCNMGTLVACADPWGRRDDVIRHMGAPPPSASWCRRPQQPPPRPPYDGGPALPPRARMRIPPDDPARKLDSHSCASTSCSNTMNSTPPLRIHKYSP